MKLQARGLTLTAGNRTLLRDFSVDMEPGQTWIVLGGNGSGKTTLLHTLAGLRAAEHGEIRVDDQLLTQMSHRHRAQQIGILFQDYDILFPGTVMETMLTARYPWSGWMSLWRDEAKDRQIAEQALQKLGLDHLAHRSMTTLSGGERRRVQVAALLAQTVPVRLLDEPTNHLDLRHQVEVLELVCGSNDKSTASPNRPTLDIVVLHDVNQAMSYGTHAILLFADGTGMAGAIGDIVNKESLERLYQCKLREVGTADRSYYLPV